MCCGECAKLLDKCAVCNQSIERIEEGVFMDTLFLRLSMEMSLNVQLMISLHV